MPNPNLTEVDATPVLGEVLESYGAMDYRWHQAIGEFVDNSYDSFERYAQELTGEWNIDISHDSREGILRIRDNAYGMDQEELSRAVKLAKRNVHGGGIGKYGLGMKTAASWIGKEWTVKTKRKDSTLEWTAKIDIPSLISGGSNNIPFTAKIVATDTDSHYTVVEIKGFRRRFAGRAIGKAKLNLVHLYGRKILGGKLNIRWGQDILDYNPPNFLTEIESDSTETTWYSNLPDDFTVNGHPVSGSFGILAGAEDIPHAGITLIWRNRVIEGGHRSGWKPEEIYGISPSDLRWQRVWGEIHLNCLEPNQQKKGFIWQEFSREDLVDALQPIMMPHARYAGEMRRRETNKPSHGQMQLADAEVKGALESEELSVAMQESIKVMERPTEEISEEVALAIESSDPTPLRISVNDGEPTVTVFKNPEEHQLERFMRTRIPAPDMINLYLNINHRFFSEFVGDDLEKYELWQQFCIALALVEFNADRLPHDPTPGQIWGMLDEILKRLERHNG